MCFFTAHVVFIIIFKQYRYVKKNNYFFIDSKIIQNNKEKVKSILFRFNESLVFLHLEIHEKLNQYKSVILN